jgi:hypothetical protein
LSRLRNRDSAFWQTTQESSLCGSPISPLRSASGECELGLRVCYSPKLHAGLDTCLVPIARILGFKIGFPMKTSSDASWPILTPASQTVGQGECAARSQGGSVKGGVKPGHCGGPYIYSAAEHRSRGAPWPSFAPALRIAADQGCTRGTKYQRPIHRRHLRGRTYQCSYRRKRVNTRIE